MWLSNYQWYIKIKRFLFPLTAREQEEIYLKANGYPKETVRFLDRNGRLSQLIGSDVLTKNYDKLRRLKMQKIINKEDFIKQYCSNSDITEEELLTTQVVVSCICDYEFCNGWKVINKTGYGCKENN